VQLRIDTGDADENLGLFEEIETHRTEIETRFGEPLSWNPAENYRACIVRYDVPDSAGWKSPVDEREPGMNQLAQALIRFHAALDPVLSELA